MTQSSQGEQDSLDGHIIKPSSVISPQTTSYLSPVPLKCGNIPQPRNTLSDDVNVGETGGSEYMYVLLSTNASQYGCPSTLNVIKEYLSFQTAVILTIGLTLLPLGTTNLPPFGYLIT